MGRERRHTRLLGSIALSAAVVYVVVAAALALFQRRLLYFPSHHAHAGSRLEVWEESGAVWGARRVVERPRAVWLVLHGNAGQAAQREYVLDVLPSDVCVYVLEYPGYGARAGAPSRASIDAAAIAAHRRLGELYPDVPRGVLGESLGSGPAAQLAREPQPPDAIVLAVPHHRLADVAADAFPWLPVRWILQDDWDNGAALADFAGRLVILAAEHDVVIPIEHARALAAKLPSAELRVLLCGHDDWSRAVPPGLFAELVPSR
jgi:hypothetical protein